MVYWIFLDIWLGSLGHLFLNVLFLYFSLGYSRLKSDICLADGIVARALHTLPTYQLVVSFYTIDCFITIFSLSLTSLIRFYLSGGKNYCMCNFVNT